MKKEEYEWLKERLEQDEYNPNIQFQMLNLQVDGLIIICTEN
jgi:hypothetical protein